jgi:hypothetical protein
MAKAPVEAVAADQAAQAEGGAAGLVIDLSQVGEEKEFAVIPRGVYDAQVDDVTFSHSQASGNPMWTWKLELLDSAGEFAGRKVFFHSPFIEVMMPRVKKIISRVAPELLNGPFNPEEVANSGVLVGKPCKVRLDISMYEGKRRNNVKDILQAVAAGGEASCLAAPQ